MPNEWPTIEELEQRARLWEKQADGMSQQADYCDLVGNYGYAKKLNAGAAEAFAKARECRDAAKKKREVTI